MRRLLTLATLLGTVGVLTGTNGVAASAPRAQTPTTVPLIVLKTKDGQAAALVSVVIHGRAFPFIVDTGATRTVVNLALARELHLKTIGPPIKVSGVGCVTPSRNVRLSDWSIGTQSLPAITAISVKIPFSNGRGFGLLGSDVLSRFGSVGIDYTRGELTLG
jgi:predicted aspartyl protease